MVNLKLVSKIALFFGIASAAFTVILAILNVLIIQIASTGSAPVPTDYLVYYILTIIFPYLFITVLSFIVAALSKRYTQETVPPAEMQSTTETA
jgi:peptidoglycan biosynthesis protein MviN/MurJ (putative lipid II flippase)